MRQTRQLILATSAAIVLAAGFGTAAEAQRDRRRAPQVTPQTAPSAQQSRMPDRYTTVRGEGGVITATTPNQWGNFGGPSTGGSGGGGP
ncbi:MAG: hypothetical protein JWR08_267 [Enterovirga sp.]|nr:hypothetical protein [Enterovirga sp.]